MAFETIKPEKQKKRKSLENQTINKAFVTPGGLTRVDPPYNKVEIYEQGLSSRACIYSVAISCKHDCTSKMQKPLYAASSILW
jgi:hypothetical protein